MHHWALFVHVAGTGVAKKLLLHLHLGVLLGIELPVHDLVSKVKDDEPILSMGLHVVGLVLADQHRAVAELGGSEVLKGVGVGALARLLLHEPRHKLVIVGLLLHPVHNVKLVQLPELATQKVGDGGGVGDLALGAIGDVVGDAHC